MDLSGPSISHAVKGSGLSIELRQYCVFQQCGILTSIDSDKPVQPPFKLRNSKLCSSSSLTVIDYSSDLQSL